MKLAVALQLKIEGYETLVFNKIVKAGSRSVAVDVFAEDCLGSRVAVYCVFRADEAEEGHLNDVACAILDGFGEDCLIAIAFPLRLIDLVRNAIGIANWIYLVDYYGRIWRHDPNIPYRSTSLAWKPAEKLDGKMILQPEGQTSSRAATRQDFYVT
jgi:hypothetical protein